MPVFLDASDQNFEESFVKILDAKREDSPDVDYVVSEIIADVRARGDAALFEKKKKFDRQLHHDAHLLLYHHNLNLPTTGLRRGEGEPHRQAGRVEAGR